MSYRFTLTFVALILAWAYFIVVPRYPSVAAKIGPWTAVQGQTTAKRVSTAKRDFVAGSPGVLQVTVQQSAVDRIDIRTAPIQEVKVLRTRMVWGEVVAFATAPEAPASAVKVADADLLIRIPLPGSTDLPAADQPAKVFPLSPQTGQSGGGAGILAQAMGGAFDSKDGRKVAYFLAQGARDALRPGQRVQVEIALAAYDGVRKVVPYSAVVYDPKGGAWVFVNTKPLSYLRRPVKVDYVNGDIAVLVDAPPAGTPVAISGVMELFGAESGVGH